MLKNYLLVTLRALRRRPGTTALHVGGLAVGLACCFLAGLYVQDELRYDRFHDNAERIFQLSDVRTFGDRTISLLSTDSEGIETLKSAVPGIEAVAVLEDEAVIVRRPGREGVDTESALFAEPGFFDVFTFPLLRGDAATALAAPDQGVLTTSFARTLFGDDDPMGQTIELERSGFGARDPEPLALTVVGVAADPPGASSIQFDLLVSGATLVTGFGDPAPYFANSGPTYIRTRSAADTIAVKAALDELAAASEEPTFGTRAGTRTRPLVDLHLGGYGEGLSGKPLYLTLFSAVAALVLLLACINYANLATAIALGRAREVGVRKAVGAGRRQLTVQFLTEAFVLAAAAGVLAVGLVSLALPGVNAFFGKQIALGAVGPWLPLAALGIVGATALVAGLYPAFVLASFRPAAVLKGDRVQGRGGTRVRQTLVVVQFAVTAILLAGTAVVAEQLRYAQQRDLGFSGDQVVTLPLRTTTLIEQRDVLRQAMEAVPDVRRASLTSGSPGDFVSIMQLEPPDADEGSPDVQSWFARADADYADALGLELVAGRWFHEGEPETSLVLNEAAARDLGLMTDDASTAIGQTLGALQGKSSERTVGGVLRDFHFAGLRREIAPLTFFPLRDEASHFLLALRLDHADLPGALAAVRGTWERLAPEYPFEATFVDDRFAEQLREDRQLGQLFGVVAGIAVVLALFGLLGLAAHATERRRKEVGVRKVLGATVASIVLLLTRDFARLVLIALVVAVPIAVLLAQRWLENFAYPVPLGATPFVLVGLGLLALALGTVSLHAHRAATDDPIAALRTE
jgi:putative ABC transport system permease protein